MKHNDIEIKRVGSSMGIVAPVETMRLFLEGLAIVEGDVIEAYKDQDLGGMVALDAYQDVRNQIRQALR